VIGARPRAGDQRLPVGLLRTDERNGADRAELELVPRYARARLRGAFGSGRGTLGSMM
jgi:hypothetical protein